MNEVRQYDVNEITLRAVRRWGKPFVQVRVELECTARSGHILHEGLHDGVDIWRVRVAPDEPHC